MKGKIIKIGNTAYVYGRRFESAKFISDKGMEFDVYIRALPNKVKS